MRRNRKSSLWARQFASLVVVLGASISLARAGTSIGMVIPNVFTAGSTISSAGMNANFSAVASQLPAVSATNFSFPGIGLTAGAIGEMVNQPFTAPANGYVVARVDGYASVPSQGTAFQVWVTDVSKSFGNNSSIYPSTSILPSTGTNLTLPFAYTRVFTVTAGSYTYHVDIMGSVSGTGYALTGALTLEFFPNGM